MKPFSKIGRFFYQILNWRKVRKDKKYQGIINELDAALKRKTIEQDKLKGEILIYMQKFLGVKSWSKYIPKRYRNDAKIVAEIRARFGSRMDALDVKITDSARLI